MAHAIVYLLCSVLFYAVFGVNIYDAIDWSDPSGTGRLVALIIFLGMPILWSTGVLHLPRSPVLPSLHEQRPGVGQWHADDPWAVP